MAVATPAQRARQRADAAIGTPPVISLASRRSDLANLQIVISGKPYLIAPEGDPQLASAIDSTATVTIAVRDTRGVLQAALADEQVILAAGVSMTINGYRWMLQSANVDTSTGTLVTLVFEDEVAWRLRQYTRFLAIPRAKNTRAQAALRLITEASGSPLAPLAYYIPQLTDQQRIASPAKTTAAKPSGTGSSAFTVKGARATAEQRRNIDAILTEASSEGASSRVMVATIMAATQESGLTTSATNGIHFGLFQQDPNWGSTAQRRDATQSTILFLDGWKREHGSLKSAPGNLGDAIDKVQRSGLPALYLQWYGEAQQTVSAWGGGSGSGGTRTVVEPFEFTRGQQGQVESSWDATGRWATEVNWRRWAEHNTFFFASDDELRQQAPSLTVKGDEEWLLAPPAFDWNPNRAVQQVTLSVTATRWGLSVGACVILDSGAPTDGRFLVTALASGMASPVVEATLSRPSTKLPEPAPTTNEVATGGSGGSGGGGAGSTAAGTSSPTAGWNPRGKPISNWIIPILTWASAHGWGGQVTSGFRTHAEQLAAATSYVHARGLTLEQNYPSGVYASNHCATDYPGGAVDVTSAQQLADVLKSYPRKPTLVWGTVIDDAVHFSSNGH